VDDLHIDDHPIFLHFGLSGLLRGVIHADALATLGCAASIGCLEFIFERKDFAGQLFVDPLYLFELSPYPVVLVGDYLL
jgi:hypothetical protein